MVKIFHKFLPTQNLFETPTVGLSLSDQFVRFTELLPSRDDYVLGRYGERSIPPEIYENGLIKDKQGFKRLLNSLRAKHRLSAINVSIPELPARVFYSGFPSMDKARLYEAVEKKVAGHEQSAAGNVVFGYEIVSENRNGYEVQVSVFGKAGMEKYFELFEGTGLRPLFFETESQSVARAVIPRDDKATRVVVDFGETRIVLSMVRSGAAVFSAQLPGSFDGLISFVSKELKVGTEGALRMIMEDGLKNKPGEKEFRSGLIKLLSAFKDDIDKQIIDWQIHQKGNGKAYGKIESIELCGIGANIPVLAEYLSSSLRTPVSVANVWTNVNSFDEYIPEVPLRDSLRYAAAIGVALGSVYERE